MNRSTEKAIESRLLSRFKAGLKRSALEENPVDDPLEVLAGDYIRRILLARFTCQYFEVDGVKSPIERVFWLALLCAATAYTREDVLLGHCSSSGHVAPNPWAPDQLEVCLQHRIGCFTVDFFLRGYSTDGGGSKELSSVVVECDGHDFHERTKEQARSDKSRDRTLQDAGHKVYRFTGSEIHANPISCAQQALRAAFKVAR